MTLRIMRLNMRKLRRIAKRRDIPVQIPQPLMDIRIPRSDVPDVRLEVLHIDGIEADDGRVEAHVGFGDVVAVVEWA